MLLDRLFQRATVEVEGSFLPARVDQVHGNIHQYDLFALLIERLTQSPPGSEVTLQSGERAIVVKTFAEAPHRPLVRVFEDADGETLAEPFDVDLREDLESAQPIVEVLLKPSLARTQLPREDD